LEAGPTCEASCSGLGAGVPAVVGDSSRAPPAGASEPASSARTGAVSRETASRSGMESQRPATSGRECTAVLHAMLWGSSTGAGAARHLGHLRRSQVRPGLPCRGPCPPEFGQYYGGGVSSGDTTGALDGRGTQLCQVLSFVWEADHMAARNTLGPGRVLRGRRRPEVPPSRRGGPRVGGHGPVGLPMARGHLSARLTWLAAPREEQRPPASAPANVPGSPRTGMCVLPWGPSGWTGAGGSPHRACGVAESAPGLPGRRIPPGGHAHCGPPCRCRTAGNPTASQCHRSSDRAGPQGRRASGGGGHLAGSRRPPQRRSALPSPPPVPQPRAGPPPGAATGVSAGHRQAPRDGQTTARAGNWAASPGAAIGPWPVRECGHQTYAPGRKLL
jgi:hypothetical protein